MTRRPYLPAIDGLRAVAILLVVAYHAGIPEISGGFIGVDVFFVLSGYLIIGHLGREIHDTGRVGLMDFWARRARRLLPAAAVVIVATLLAGAVILPPGSQQQTATAGLTSATYVSNLWFALRSTDYLGDEGSNPLLHTWSLSVEEQFYLFWPLALAAIAMTRLGSSARRLVWLAAVITVASCVWAVIQHRVAPSWAFFSPLTRAWEFAIGGLVALSPSEAASSRGRGIFGFAGVAFIVAAALLFDGETAMPGLPALVPVLGTAMVLRGVDGATDGYLDGPYRWLSSAPMRWMGRASYSWYLWHWPAAVLLVAWLQLDTIGVRLVAMIVALALAELTRRWVENPVRFHPRLVGQPRLVLLGSAALVLTLVFVAWDSGTRATRLGEHLIDARIAEAKARPVLYSNGCFVAAAEVRYPHCVSGDTTSSMHVVLVGDSHAAQWYPALEPIAARAGWRLETFTKGACSLAEVAGSGPRAEEDSCVEWRSTVVRRILESKPDLVITASFAHLKWPGDEGGRYRAAEWGEGLRHALARLDSARIATILLRNPPRPGFDVPACVATLARFQRANPPLCAFDGRSARIREVAHQEELAASGLDSIKLVDLGETICPSLRCVPVLNDRLVYRDRHHLTAGYAASLSDDLWQEMTRRTKGSPTTPVTAWIESSERR